MIDGVLLMTLICVGGETD